MKVLHLKDEYMFISCLLDAGRVFMYSHKLHNESDNTKKEFLRQIRTKLY